MSRHILCLIVLLFANEGLSQTNQGVCYFRGTPDEKFIRVPEDTPPGTEIFRMTAFPRRNFNIQELDGSRTNGFFTFQDVDRRRVSLILAKSLQDLVDQSSPTNTIKFRLACRGREGGYNYLPITVYIEDVNDHIPEFINEPYEVVIDELTPPGLTIFRGIQATDRDQPNTPNSEVAYSILEGNEAQKFSLETSNANKMAVLVLRKPLDFEKGDTSFNLTIMAQDHGNPQGSSSTRVSIRVRDNDDRSPVFTQAVYQSAIEEDYPITGGSIQKLIKFNPKIRAYDQDLALDSSISYSIISGNDLGFFTINPSNGRIYSIREIDRESLPANVASNEDTFKLKIEARQRDNPLKNALAVVEIKIKDVNDNPPRFEATEYNLTLIENLRDGFEIIKFRAFDKDLAENAKFAYTINDPSGIFRLGSETGILSIGNSEEFDREKYDIIQIEIGTRESSPSLITKGRNLDEERRRLKVKIFVQDENDNAPRFIPGNKYEFTVEQNTPRASVIGVISANDPDDGMNGIIRYRIANASNPGVFGIDAATGEIRARISPLLEERYSLTVTASDQSPEIRERLSSFASVIFRISRPKRKSDDDNKGPEFPLSDQEFQISERDVPGSLLGRVIVHGNLGNDKKYRWSLIHKSGEKENIPFYINSTTGELFVSERVLGPNLQRVYNAKVGLTSKSGRSVFTNIRVRLLDNVLVGSEFGKKENVDPKRLRSIERNKKGETLVNVDLTRRKYIFSVEENLIGAPVANLTLLNIHKDDPGFLEFVIAEEDSREKFAISENGLLTTKVGLDRESRDVYNVTIMMERRGKISRKEILKFQVGVDDQNDNSPSFDRHIYRGSLRVNAEPGTEVKLDRSLHVRDPDLDDVLNLQLLGKGSEYFSLDPQKGKVILLSRIDDPKRMTESDNGPNGNKIYLRVRASDSVGHITESQLVINLLGMNDSPPVIRGLSIMDKDFAMITVSGDLTVKESAPVGTVVAKLMIISSDAKETFKYILTSETTETVIKYHPKRQTTQSIEQKQNRHFQVDEFTGNLVVLRKLNPSQKHMLNITVVDIANGLSTQTTIVVLVRDINDHSPIFNRNAYEFRISEGTYTNVELGEVLASDSDAGLNGEVVYSIIEDSDPITIDPRLGTLVINGALDAETSPRITFTVRASDSSTDDTRNYNDVPVVVLVLDENEFGPRFVQNSATSEIFADIPIGAEIFRAEARDPDLTPKNNKVSYRILPENNGFFEIGSKSGVVFTTSELKEKGNSTATLTLEARDPQGLKGESLLKVRVKARRKLVTTTRSTSIITAVIRTTTSTTTSTSTTTARRLPIITGVAHIQRATVSRAVRPLTPSHRLFIGDTYRLDVLENLPTPAKLLNLNALLSAETRRRYNFSTTKLETESNELFKVRSDEDPMYLYAIKSPDRESKEDYVIFVGARIIGHSRPSLIYSVFYKEKRSSSLIKRNGFNMDQIKLDIHILDANDNPPQFISEENPMIVSLSSSGIRSGSLVTKIRGWDADKDLNAQIRYSILPNFRRSEKNVANIFRLNAQSGYLYVVRAERLKSGKRYDVTVEARDQGGAPGGLSSKILVLVYVVDLSHQLKLQIKSNKNRNDEDISSNVTMALSKATGMEIRPHRIERRADSNTANMYLIALDRGNLMDSNSLINSVSPKLGVARAMLLRSDYEIVNVEDAGPTLINPSPSIIETERDVVRTEGGMGSLEIGILVMACAVFLGGLIAVLGVCFVKAKRKRAYPAPLNVPLPKISKEIERTPSRIIPSNKILSSSTQSRRKIMFPQHLQKGADSSEETSDTCLEDHFFQKGICRNSRTHASTRSWKENVMSGGESGRSRDSGIIDDRRGSLTTCSCRPSSPNSSAGESYSDGEYSTKIRFSGRRHKSTSPCRAHRHHHRNSKAGGAHCCRGSYSLNKFCRGCSRSAGTLSPESPPEYFFRRRNNDHRHHHHHHHHRVPSHHPECRDCIKDEIIYGEWRSRDGHRSRSTRSTQWEVYFNKEYAEEAERKQKSSTFNNLSSEHPQKSRLFDSTYEDPCGRSKNSAGCKSHSWKGDLASLKATVGKNNVNGEDSSKRIYGYHQNPIVSKKINGTGPSNISRNQTNNPHRGIKLVGLADGISRNDRS